MTTLYDLLGSGERLEKRVQALEVASQELVTALRQMEVHSPVSLHVKIKARNLKEVLDAPHV